PSTRRNTGSSVWISRAPRARRRDRSRPASAARSRTSASRAGSPRPARPERSASTSGEVSRRSERIGARGKRGSSTSPPPSRRLCAATTRRVAPRGGHARAEAGGVGGGGGGKHRVDRAGEIPRRPAPRRLTVDEPARRHVRGHVGYVHEEPHEVPLAGDGEGVVVVLRSLGVD